jgi:DNA-binding phage protein
MKTSKWNIYDHLTTEEEIDGFIEASIEEAKEDTGPKYLIPALDTTARARGMLRNRYHFY